VRIPSFLALETAREISRRTITVVVFLAEGVVLHLQSSHEALRTLAETAFATFTTAYQTPLFHGVAILVISSP
jgi:hypothetical protein